MVCTLQWLRLSVIILRSDSPDPSFHYSSSLPDTYNPITFYRSALAWARASLHRQKHIDPTSEPANSKGRQKKSQIHSYTINRERSAKVFKANPDELKQSNFVITDYCEDDFACDWLPSTDRKDYCKYYGCVDASLTIKIESINENK